MAFSKRALVVECMIGLVAGFLVGYTFASGTSTLFNALRFSGHIIPF